MPMGMADVATVLFEKHLKFDASAPDWPDRDRFILSAGHGSMLLYALLHLTGYKGMGIEEIRNFRQWKSPTAGHPENFLHPAIETTTGPLGQGIANSVGFAMAEEILRARYSRKLVDHRTYVIAGDGCLMEGVSQEAITLAGRHKLGKLIVLWDNNNITIDGLKNPLAVAEACSGLRMVTIFGAMSLALMLITKRPWWDRLTVLVSAIPIALFVNVVRIVATALLYRLSDSETLHQIVHDFAGLLMLPLAIGLLYLEQAVLARLTIQAEGLDGPPGVGSFATP